MSAENADPVPELSPIEWAAVRLVDLLELRHAENGGGDFHAIGVYELCTGIRALAAARQQNDGSSPGIDPELLRLVDHVEMEHEREIAPGTTLAQVRKQHKDMHEHGDDDNQYGHTMADHRKGKV